jgi:hypothetical protein
LVTLAAGGKNEREVAAGSIVVPDLWHICRLIEQAAKGQGEEAERTAARMAERVKRTWHLAHDLHNHILHSVDLGPMELLATTYEGDK